MLGIPVLADTALGFSTLVCHALRVLYEGPSVTEDEAICRELMQSKVLQRYKVTLYSMNKINILAVRKVGHLNIKTKMFDFETRILIGWLARVFSQPIRTRASKSNIFVFMLRWPTFVTASIGSWYKDPQMIFKTVSPSGISSRTFLSVC